MREIKRSALVNRSAEDVYAVIDDVERYPQFIPWCTHARVLSRTPVEAVATVGVRQGPVHGEFTTRNRLEPGRSIHMQFVSGPFRVLEGTWRLEPLAGGGCRVDLQMRFAFKSALTGMLFERTFAETLASLVDAFVARARSLP